MRFFHSSISAVAIASFLALWSGCAYMNNGSLDDLIPDPSQTLNDQSLLSDLKLDPASDHLARQIEKSEREIAQTPTNPSVSAEEIQPEFTEFEAPDFPIENEGQSLLPINNSLRKTTIKAEPIVLKAANKGPLPPNNPPAEPTEIDSDAVPPSANLSFEEVIELPADQFIDAALRDNQGASRAKNDSLPLNPLTPSNSAEKPLSPVPVSEPPQDSSMVKTTSNDFEVRQVQSSNDKASIESFEEFQKYVSYEMQFLIPPFAMHPELDDPTEDDSNVINGSLKVPPSPTRKTKPSQPKLPLPQFETSKEVEQDGIPETQEKHSNLKHDHVKQDNYFVGNRIESEEEESPLPPFETQSAELPTKFHESSANPKADLATAPRTENSARNNSSAKITWQGQLDRTIDVFESAFETTVDHAEAANLESGLAILKALKKNMRPASDSPEELREYWSHQIKAINELLADHTTGGDSRVAATALEELRLSVQNLQVVADLKVFNASICKSVSGYGQYTTFANNEFVPHQTILVYCEIDNFAPLLETNNAYTSYQTRLSSSFTVRDGQGTVVQHQDFPVVTDSARNLRRDFFMHLPVTFAELEPGSYELQLTVRDHGSDKTAELDRRLKFTIR